MKHVISCWAAILVSLSACSQDQLSDSKAIESADGWLDADKGDRIYLALNDVKNNDISTTNIYVIGCVGESEDPAAMVKFPDPNGKWHEKPLNERKYVYEFHPVEKGQRAEKPGECEILWGDPRARGFITLGTDFYDVLEQNGMTIAACAGVPALAGSILKTLHEQRGIRGMLAKLRGTNPRARAALLAGQALTLFGGTFWCAYHSPKIGEKLRDNAYMQRLLEFLAFTDVVGYDVATLLSNGPGADGTQELQNDSITYVKLAEQIRAGEEDLRVWEQARQLQAKHIVDVFNKATPQYWQDHKIVGEMYPKRFKEGEFFQGQVWQILDWLWGGKDQTFEALRRTDLLAFDEFEDPMDKIRPVRLPDSLSEDNREGCEAMVIRKSSATPDGYAMVYTDSGFERAVGYPAPVGMEVWRYRTLKSAESAYVATEVVLGQDLWVDDSDGQRLVKKKGDKVWINSYHLSLRRTNACLQPGEKAEQPNFGIFQAN